MLEALHSGMLKQMPKVVLSWMYSLHSVILENIFMLKFIKLHLEGLFVDVGDDGIFFPERLNDGLSLISDGMQVLI